MRDGIATYFIEFFLKGEEKTLFSAYVKNPNYSLRESILQTFFSRGNTYTWKVKGLDNFNKTVAESAKSTFTVQE